ncbi:gamma-glutamyltransferase [Aureimonas ureilytica]|uniref:gamma-glutamyltransferase n=1 Tax=Aureimonas ureilytica TaxID=401562 RepID=UPI0003736D9E|nr:gamma-glutamyltransferase [Aureimonas ureilytica]
MRQQVRRVPGFRLVLATCLVWSVASGAEAASPAPVAGKNGMVVTAQRLASEVGVDVLRSGGNAVDAAVAVGYALAVTYPTAGNLGGGGFMTLRLKDGTTRFLDFRERAPGRATKDMYLDAKGEPVPGLSTDGYLAVGVPGSVAGFELARERYGTKDRAALIAPAIRLAREGFELSPGDVASFTDANADLAKDAGASAIFLKNGTEPYAAGERLVQSDLAGVLEAISERGPDGFYRGAAAEGIAKASAAHGGILERADFEAYKVRELEPVRCDYRGYEIISSPPPSSGGVVICEILNILEAYPLGYTGFGSAETVHLMAEAMRQGFVDRNSALGDPDFVKNPVETLLSQAYADKVRARIDPNRAGVSAAMKPVGAESHETTHYSIIDKDGNAVAVTYTLNGSFGARVVAPGTGVLLNNEMDDFTQKPGVPNLYGLVQGEANAIAPGKTPLSSMSPTIVTQGGEPVLVIGSPGGSRIITIVAEAILNVVDHGMTIQEAVDAPRIHHQWQPDRITIEPRALSPDTIRLLAEKGHRVAEDPNWPVWGQAAGILVGGPSLADRDPARPERFFGAIDARAGSGAAIGY